MKKEKNSKIFLRMEVREKYLLVTMFSLMLVYPKQTIRVHLIRKTT